MQLPEFITIFEDEYVKLTYSDIESDRLIFCFSGVGMGLGGIEIQKEEFLGSTKKSNVVFVLDKTRSWSNAINYTKVIELMGPFVRGKTLSAIGNSMGGFNAIVASHYFKFDSCIAFVPQYSVNSEIAYLETRWRHWIDKIKVWRYQSLEDFFSGETNYYLFFAENSPQDIWHHDMIPSRPNVKKYKIPTRHDPHRLVAELKAKGVLYELILLCQENRGDREIQRCLSILFNV